MRRPTAVSVLGRTALFARGLLYTGGKHQCPCCGWNVRSFVAGGGSLRRRGSGYCPRCNSKARHRRVWLYLNEYSKPSSEEQVLVIAPHESTSRALKRRKIRRVSIDLGRHPGVDVVASATSMPFPADMFDLVLSVHVLEHLEDDHAAMSEVARVLSREGRALINVPCEWDSLTREDPAVTSPERRRMLFGEPDHRRWYGRDIVDRLSANGLDVETHLGTGLAASVVELHGLSESEHLFVCRRADR